MFLYSSTAKLICKGVDFKHTWRLFSCTGVLLKQKKQRFRAASESEPEKPLSFQQVKKSAPDPLLESIRTPNPRLQDKTPCDGTFLISQFPNHYYPFYKAIEYHRTLCSQEMLNNPDAVLCIYADVNLRTKKKTKFVSSLRGFVRLPFDFSAVERKVLALCKDQDSAKTALDAGAVYAGGAELIEQIQGREIIPVADFNHVIATNDMIQPLLEIRRFLLDLLPKKETNTISDDIAKMMDDAKFGISYESVSEREADGHLQVPFGKVSMPLPDLEANFDALVTHIDQNKPSQSKGTLLRHIFIKCPPSSRAYLVRSPLEEYTK